MGGICAEVVAVVANMVECGAAGGWRSVMGAERKITGLASGAPGGRVFASVNAGAGAVQRPLDRASVRDRGGGGAGWAGRRERIVVVDGDLGVSGRDAQAREGYKELVARVCLRRGRRDLRAGGLEAWRAPTRTSSGCLSSAR